MLYAIKDKHRIRPTPHDIAMCPVCNQEVFAKCGEINVWHWSHYAAGPGLACQECIDTQWAIYWKQRVSPDMCEIHADGFVIDLIDTHLRPVKLCPDTPTPDLIRRYEERFTNMVWLVDAHPFESNMSFRERDYGLSFRWKWPRKVYWGCTRPIYFDYGDWLFSVKKLYPDVPCGGWGREVDPEVICEEQP